MNNVIYIKKKKLLLKAKKNGKHRCTTLKEVNESQECIEVVKFQIKIFEKNKDEKNF